MWFLGEDDSYAIKWSSELEIYLFSTLTDNTSITPSDKSYEKLPNCWTKFQDYIFMKSTKASPKAIAIYMVLLSIS